MSYNLFLDDERYPKTSYIYGDSELYETEDWKIVRNYNDFVKFIKENGVPKLVSFDHDLSEEHYKASNQTFLPYSDFKVKTGYHCLQWLLLYCAKVNAKPPKILIHTLNLTGAENMKTLINIHESVYRDL